MARIVATVGLPAVVSAPGTQDIELRFYPELFDDANVQLDASAIAEACGRALSPRAQDLLEIGAAVYMTDRAVARDEHVDPSRVLHLVLPVRDNQFWNDRASELGRMLGLITKDTWVFEFVAHCDPRRTLTTTSRRSKPEFDSVALLSGGIDSLAGAASLLREGQRPLLLRHYTVEHQTSDNIVKGFRKAGFRTEIINARVTGSRSTKSRALPVPEYSQRSRSFLFLSLGAVAATMLRVPRLYMNENGILAVHLPIGLSRIGSYSTQTAHPDFLQRFAILASDALEHDLAIENNLLYKTKQDCVETAIQTGFAGLIPGTVSCWAARRVPGMGSGATHCGYCIPCLHRQLALGAHGVFEKTNVRYPLRDFVNEDDDRRVNAEELITFIGKVDAMPSRALLQHYPLLTSMPCRA